ncbi:hypothetical protein ES703_109814 [subsurface metagenome]
MKENLAEMIDKTGEPRSDEELQEAIDCVKEIMVKHSTILPLFTVHALLILNCLEELQNLRRMLKEARKRRLEQ